MTFTLGARAQKAGHHLVVRAQSVSTNAEALALARAGETGPLWLVTDWQTGGRGRRGRPWLSPPGNLAASFLQHLDIAPGEAATLGFAAGLALVRALDKAASASALAQSVPDLPQTTHAAPIAFRLKWPNDVLAGGAKLAGILLESDRVPGGGLALVTGLGVNVVSAPDDVPYPATSLAALGLNVSAFDLFTTLGECWCEALDLWQAGQGMGRLRQAWLSHAAGIGERVTIEHEGERVAGRFETIDDGGRMVIVDAQGAARTIAAGDVFFGRTASSR